MLVCLARLCLWLLGKQQAALWNINRGVTGCRAHGHVKGVRVLAWQKAWSVQDLCQESLKQAIMRPGQGWEGAEGPLILGTWLGKSITGYLTPS